MWKQHKCNKAHPMANAITQNKIKNTRKDIEVLQNPGITIVLLYEVLQLIKFCASMLKYLGFVKNITMSATHNDVVNVDIMRAVVTQATNAR